MSDLINTEMTIGFPETVEEFMEQNKVVDTDHVYSNGVEFVPIFRMKQWFEHTAEKTGKWVKISPAGIYECSACGQNVMTTDINVYRYCPNCGASMVGENEYLHS